MTYKPKCWNKGIPRTAKEKENISKGIPKESKKRCAERMKARWKAGEFNNAVNGPSQSPEARIKISKASKGRVLSKEARALLSKARKGQPGNPVSEEMKQRASKRMKLNNPMFRKDVLSNHPVLKSGPSFLSIGENKLIELFTQLGFKFKHQEQFAKQRGFYTADFYFPDQNKIIEFDGHHSHVEFPEKDKIRDSYIFENYGVITLRLLPPDLNTNNRKELIKKLYTFLGYEIETNKNIEQKMARRKTNGGLRFNRTR